MTTIKDDPQERDSLRKLIMAAIKHDPQERDPKLKKLISAAGKQAEENLSHIPKGLGRCHMVWGEQKRILKVEYDIDWKSPAEMNPGIRFD